MGVVSEETESCGIVVESDLDSDGSTAEGLARILFLRMQHGVVRQSGKSAGIIPWGPANERDEDQESRSRRTRSIEAVPRQWRMIKH